MNITEARIDHLSDLARLSLPGGEKEEIARELERILDYMAVLDGLDTAGAEPLSHVFPLKNVLRPMKPPLRRPGGSAGRGPGRRRGELSRPQSRGVRWNMELYELTALELAGQLRAGAVTQAEAIAAAAGRIAACQPGNNAFITVADSPAPAPTLSASPLAGVPMAYKDNLCTRGMRTTAPPKFWGTSPPATTPPPWSA
mgnify:CR=1 FL=1